LLEAAAHSRLAVLALAVLGKLDARLLRRVALATTGHHLRRAGRIAPEVFGMGAIHEVEARRCRAVAAAMRMAAIDF